MIMSIDGDWLSIEAVRLGISSDALAVPDVLVIPLNPDISLVISHENVTFSDGEDAINGKDVPPEQISWASKSSSVAGLGFIVILKIWESPSQPLKLGVNSYSKVNGSGPLFVIDEPVRIWELSEG